MTSPANILLALANSNGDSFDFHIDSAAFDKLTRKTEWRWPKSDRMTVGPARQFTGPGDDQIELSGTIYPHIWGSVSVMDDLRSLANAGLPVSAATGTGKVLGRYVIERVEDDRSWLIDNGQPRKIEFKLTLSIYGEDP